MVGAWHGHGMASVKQTRPHCVNQMGKTHSKPLAARHGHGVLCVNRPLLCRKWSELNVEPHVHVILSGIRHSSTNKSFHFIAICRSNMASQLNRISSDAI